MITQLPIKNSYIPLRIRQARVSRIMSQDELAKSIDITKQAVSQYETGNSKPSEVVMREISNVLHYPMTFFTKEPSAILSAPSFYFFRSYKTASVKEKAAWIQKVAIFEEFVISKLKEYIEFPKINLPTIDEKESYSMDDCEQIAMEAREFWGLGKGPIQNLIDVIQENGIIIANMKKIDKKIDAFSTIYNRTPYIYISEDTVSSVRWRFSLAHELGHLIMHKGFYEEGGIPDEIHDALEDEADFFASGFLMPQNSFFNDVNIITLDYFLYLKKKWKTSISSMILKCKNFEIISSLQTEALYKKMAIKKWRISEPYDDICKDEKPYLLKQAFKLLIDNNLISSNSIETDFGIYENELAEWSFTPLDVFTFQKNELIPLKLRPV